VYTYSQLRKYEYTKESSLNPHPNALEPDPSKHNCIFACVIAQQYSSAPSASLRFHPRTENFGAQLKNFIISIFNFLSIV
jgi:hypothetical protein